MGNGSGMAGMWFGWPIGVLVMVLVVVLLMRSGSSGGRRGSGSGSRSGSRTGRSHAEQILDERYARGELTDEEYRDRLGRLRGGPDR